MEDSGGESSLWSPKICNVSNPMAPLNSRDSQLPRPSSSSSTSSLSSYTKPGSTSEEEPKRDIQKNNNGSCSYNTQNPCRNAGSLTVGGLLSGVHDSNSVTGSSSLVDAEVSLIDARNPTLLISTPDSAAMDGKSNGAFTGSRTVDDLWREIVVGNRKELKEEVLEEMITLEDFLQAKAQEVDGEDIKFPLTERLSGGVVPFDLNPLSSFQALDGVEGAIVGFGNGADMAGYGREGRRGKRRRAALEPLDEAAQQRQRRMIKNRESAARSRERKQAYQIELESLAARLEEENQRLLKEKAERAKERLKQLMEKVIPVVERRRPPRVLCRGHSFEW